MKIEQVGADELVKPAPSTPAETTVPCAAAPATEAAADAAIDADVASESSGPSWASFQNSLGNVLLALLFFVVLIPAQSPQVTPPLAKRPRLMVDGLRR